MLAHAVMKPVRAMTVKFFIRINTFFDYFNNESEISLVVALTENNLGTSNFMTFTLPRIKLSSDTKDDGEKGIVSQNSFQALKGSGANGLEATTIQIQDSAAA